MISRALVQLSLRQLVGWRRLGLWLFLLILSAFPLLIMAVMLQAGRLDPRIVSEGFLRELFKGFQLPLVYPAIALLLTATALREEIQNETIVYLWTKPVLRATIVLAKYAAAILTALLFAGLSLVATALLATSNWDLIGRLLLTTALALLAYGAFFLALSLFFDRALIWGFAYILGWEESLSRISPAATQLSIRHYAEGFAHHLLGLPTDVSMAASVGVLFGWTAIPLGLAIWRFREMELPGTE